MAAAVELRNISKSFGDVVATAHVNLTLNEGEILAVLGENGAGKSTLMNILYGLYIQDEGEIYFHGSQVDIHNPEDAIRQGIGMVHQHFMLVPTMTALENIIIGNEPTKGFLLDVKRANDEIHRVSSDSGISADLNVRVRDLSVGEQQRVEILKVLYRGAEILILDEPTSVLVPSEVEALFSTLRALAESGKSIIFISHKLKEVQEISDRITVLRDGVVTGTVKTEDTNEQELANMMIGRDLVYPEYQGKETGDLVAKLSKVCVMGEYGDLVVKDIDLELYAGEVVGVAGVDGNGQSQLAETIAGLRTLVSGTLWIQGIEHSGESNIKNRIDNGVAFIPADRRLTSVLGLSLAKNAILKLHWMKPYSHKGILNHTAIRSFAESLVETYHVRCNSIDQKAETLSGGNQQKLTVSREITREPKLLVAEQPTRGLDIGATEFVREMIQRQIEHNAAILLISADLDEILQLSDRIIVMYEGAVLYQSERNEIEMEKLGLAMAGIR